MTRRSDLTDAKISALKPRSSRYTVADPRLPGHYVRITPTGAKSYVTVTRDPGGKQKWVTIGPTTLYSIEQARERAQAALKAVRAGEGIGPETFGAVARKWLKRHVANPKRRLRSEGEIKRLLDKHILPRWEGRDFASIKRRAVADMLDEVEDQHGARQADYCLAIVSGMANWYASRHNSYSSPIVRGMQRTKPEERKRSRVLDDEELKAIWSIAQGMFGDMIKIALLTGQRREKIATMRWRDLSEDGIWTISTEAREKGNPGVLGLSDAAMAIINARPRFAKNSYVFAGRGTTHANGFSKSKTALDKKLIENKHTLPHWQFHDLRRTARSLMARAGVRSDIAERVLGHAIPGIVGIYDRHAYTEEKADALKRLAALIEAILNPSRGSAVAMRVGNEVE